MPSTSPFIDLETIRLTKNGTWLSNGDEITHRETVLAFAKHLGRDETGYFIRIGNDFKRIEVEDTAYFVRAFSRENERIEIRLNDDSLETLDLDTLRYAPGRLTCQVKSGRETAKFLSQPYHGLLSLFEESERAYTLRLGAKTVSFSK